MGEFTTVGLEEVAERFLKMEAAAVKAVPVMLKKGADVLVQAQKNEAEAMGIKETAGFINSIKATPVKGNEAERYVEVYPQGISSHGNEKKGDKSNVRYATIGFIAQYGTSNLPARPYMTAANEKAHKRVNDVMCEVWREANNG